MNIKIYCDLGVSRFSAEALHRRFEKWGFNVSFIGAKTIRETSGWLDSTDLIVFPGGSVTNFKAALEESGVRKIKKAVEDGMDYLGICAGGYFGFESIHFKGLYEEKTGTGLGFCKGRAEGSLTHIFQEPTAFCHSLTSMTGIMLKAEPYTERFPAFYWGGPEFHPDSSQPHTPLHGLHQDDHPHLMGLQVKAGQGNATLISHHPELTPANIGNIPGTQAYPLELARLRRWGEQVGQDKFDESFDLLVSSLQKPARPRQTRTPGIYRQPALIAS